MSLFFKNIASQPLLFIHGKGGVGKTLFTAAFSELLNATPNAAKSSSAKKSVLKVQIDNETKTSFPSSVEVMNANVKKGFLKYASIKLNSEMLAKLLLDHKAIDYLLDASPGIKELAILSHIWDQTRYYDKVVVDMPSTGHAITLFSAFNQWAEIFENSPIAKDSAKIQSDLKNPNFCKHIIMSLPEEMPLAECEELESALKKLYPEHTHFPKVINKILPKISSNITPKKLSSLSPKNSAEDFVIQKEKNETLRLKEHQLTENSDVLFIPYFISNNTEHDSLFNLFIKELKKVDLSN